MEVLETEEWRIEVDERYFDDLVVSVEQDLQETLDFAIMIVEKSLGRRVHNYYICPEHMLIKVWIGLFK